MKEMNLPETQLRSWRPRRPSARLKRRIFATPFEVGLPSARWFWGCLGPVAACALFSLMVYNSGNSFVEKPVMAMILSNQSYAAYASGDGQTPQNHLAAVTFSWTNQSDCNSRFPLTPTTNLSN